MIVFIILYLQLLYHIQGCVFSSYVSIKRFRLRGSLSCLETSKIPNYYHVKLYLEFTNGTEYMLDHTHVDVIDGTFSLFGSCMIPKELLNAKMSLFLKISRDPFETDRQDRQKVLNFKETLDYLTEWGDKCKLSNDKTKLLFYEDIELSSNNGIINLFDMYVTNNTVYDVFGEVTKLTGLLIANDGGKSGSKFQLKSFVDKLEKAIGEKNLL